MVRLYEKVASDLESINVRPRPMGLHVTQEDRGIAK